jgi:hypothetical protein
VMVYGRVMRQVKGSGPEDTYRLCVLEEALFPGDQRSSVLAIMMFFVSLYTRRFATRSTKGVVRNKGRNQPYLSICITKRGLVRLIMRYHQGGLKYTREELKKRIN